MRYNATSQKWVNGADSYPPLIYSDDEREVGVWRDGKPLYQRIFKGQLTASALYDNICTKTDYNIDEIVNFDGYWGNKSVGYFAQLGCYIESGFFGGIYISGSTVQLYHPRNLDYYVVILRYTKTTDTPGSGTWTTQGTLAHHYSTDEQIVGTWIDGKPLYEKTVICEANGNTDHYIENIDLVTDVSARVVTSSGVCIKIPTYNTTSYYGYVVARRTNVYVYVTGEGWTPTTSQPCYATIQYTKTTDT